MTAGHKSVTVTVEGGPFGSPLLRRSALVPLGCGRGCRPIELPVGPPDENQPDQDGVERDLGRLDGHGLSKVGGAIAEPPPGSDYRGPSPGPAIPRHAASPSGPTGNGWRVPVTGKLTRPLGRMHLVISPTGWMDG